MELRGQAEPLARLEGKEQGGPGCPKGGALGRVLAWAKALGCPGGTGDGSRVAGEGHGPGSRLKSSVLGLGGCGRICKSGMDLSPPRVLGAYAP